MELSRKALHSLMCLEARGLEKVWDHCLGRGREGRGREKEMRGGRIDGLKGKCERDGLGIGGGSRGDQNEKEGYQ